MFQYGHGKAFSCNNLYFILMVWLFCVIVLFCIPVLYFWMYWPESESFVDDDEADDGDM
jgi:hypothetical protein